MFWPRRLGTRSAGDDGPSPALLSRVFVCPLQRLARCHTKAGAVPTKDSMSTFSTRAPSTLSTDSGRN